MGMVRDPKTGIGRVKKIISEAPDIKYYSPAEQLELQHDASEQHTCKSWQPVAFLTRSLTDKERGYAQIGKQATGCALWNGTIPSVHLWVGGGRAVISQAIGKHHEGAPAESTQGTTTRY